MGGDLLISHRMKTKNTIFNTFKYLQRFFWSVIVELDTGVNRDDCQKNHLFSHTLYTQASRIFEKSSCFLGLTWSYNFRKPKESLRLRGLL